MWSKDEEYMFEAPYDEQAEYEQSLAYEEWCEMEEAKKEYDEWLKDTCNVVY